MSKWKDEEEEFLRKNWEDMTIRKLQRVINNKFDNNRSYDSVRKKGRRMNLPKKEQQNNRYWNEEKIEKLENNYEDSDKEKLKDMFDEHSWKAIQKKANELGLVRFCTDAVPEDRHELVTVKENIETDSEYVKLIPFGDLHLGHPAVDENLIFDRLKEVKNLDVPYRLILMGDLWEGATVNSANFQFEVKYPPQRQYQNTLAMFNSLSDKIIGSVVGNHEDFTRDVAGIEKMRDFCREINVPFMKYTGVSTLDIEGIQYQIVAKHGSTGSSSWGGRINSAVSLNEIVPSADIYLLGHTHSRGIVTDAKYRSIGNGASKKSRYYALTGSFMDYPGTYADKRNYPPTSLGTVEFDLYTTEKKIIPKIV